jgi:hypothetical protein
MDAGALSSQKTAVESTASVAPAAKTPESTPKAAWFSAERKKQLLVFGGAGVTLLLVAALVVWLVVRSRSHAVATVAQGGAPAAQQQTTAPAPAVETPPAEQPANATPPATPPAAAVSAAPKKTLPAIPPPQGDTASQSSNATGGNGTASNATGALPAIPPPVPEPPAKPDAPAISTQAVPVSVGDAVPFRIALAEDVPLDADEGQELTFRASDDVKAGDVVVIAKGATVKGAVVNGNGKRFLGIGGRMTYKLISVEAVDGQKIAVRASVGRRTDGPTVRPVDTGKYAKKKELAAARGTDYVAYIDGDQTITLRK